MNTQTHLTSNELADRLRIKPNTPNTWRTLGKGPKFIKAGRVILYPVTEVEAWERDNLISSLSQAR